MKQIVEQANYTFSASGKTITFSTQIPASIAHILHVTNVTRGVIYFQPQAGSSYSGTYASPVLTLACSTSGHADADKLEIFYDDGVGMATETTLSAISGKLPATLGAKTPTTALGVTGSTVTASGNITTQNLVPAGTATANSAVEITLSGLSTLAVQVTGTYTGALSLQATVDGSTWVTVGGTPFLNSNTGTYLATITSALQSVFQCEVGGFVKVRVTALAAVTGTAAVTLLASPGSTMVALDAALPAGTALIGGVNVSQVNGVTPDMNAGAASANTLRVALATNSSTNVAQIGGTNVVTGGVAGIIAVGGNIAHSTATTANPVPTGGRVTSTTIAGVDTTLAANDTAWVPMTTGWQVLQKQFATAELDWAANVSFTPTVWASTSTPTIVRAASGTASVRTYISAMQLSADALGGATSFWLLDGAVSVSSATVATPGVITSGTHDFKVGDAVVFQNFATLALTGVSANQVVYVVTVPSSTTFTVALTPGGTGVQCTASGTATVYRILHQQRLQTAALTPTQITFPSPLRTAANVALTCISSSTQTGTIYPSIQGYYGF